MAKKNNKATINLDGWPSPKQEQFLMATTKYIGYGGSRGGGKSWSVRYKAVLGASNNPGLKILIVRRTFPELRENHILPLTAMLGETVKYKDSAKSFDFPNGSRIKLGYIASDADITQYQGQEYDWIFIDEATQITEFQFDIFKACLRGANDHPKRIYITCNPGGKLLTYYCLCGIITVEVMKWLPYILYETLRMIKSILAQQHSHSKKEWLSIGAERG